MIRFGAIAARPDLPIALVGPTSIPVAIVIIIAAGALAALAMLAVRHLTRAPLLEDPGRGATMITVVGTAFAIVLAFIIFVAFQTYTDAKTAADEEATATLEMFRTAGLFPAEERDAVRSDLVCYARAVTYSEWPAMRDGQTSPLVVPWINRWDEVLRRFNPTSDRERIAFSQFEVEDDARTNAGVARFRAASPSVPSPLWFVLILGAVLGVVLQLAVSDPRERRVIQVGLVGAVGAILAAGLLLVDYLDHPYSGETGSIKPTAMQFTLGAMDGIDPGLKPPCAADGQPLGRA